MPQFHEQIIPISGLEPAGDMEPVGDMEPAGGLEPIGDLSHHDGIVPPVEHVPEGSVISSHDPFHIIYDHGLAMM